MPARGKSPIWTTVTVSGDRKQCTSSWTTVSYEGVQRPAIKVMIAGENEKSYEIDYYVKDVGLWKVEFSIKGEMLTFWELEKLDFFSEQHK